MSADTPQHIVAIDLETLGTRPGDVVVTVGFVVLSMTGDVVHREAIGIDVESSLAAGLKIEAATLRWWMVEAPEVARRALFETPAIPLAEAALRIRELARIWCRSANCRGVYGWGSVFDNAMLHAALRAGGLAEPAWSFRLDLCGRTLCRQWGVKAESDDPHVADADALAQGRAVLAAINKQWDAREATRRAEEARDGEEMAPVGSADAEAEIVRLKGELAQAGMRIAALRSAVKRMKDPQDALEELRRAAGGTVVAAPDGAGAAVDRHAYTLPNRTRPDYFSTGTPAWPGGVVLCSASGAPRAVVGAALEGALAASGAPLDVVERQCADIVAAAIAEAAETPEVAGISAALAEAIAERDANNRQGAAVIAAALAEEKSRRAGTDAAPAADPASETIDRNGRHF